MTGRPDSQSAPGAAMIFPRFFLPGNFPAAEDRDFLCDGKARRPKRAPVLPPKSQRGWGNTDCHGHKCPRNDVGEYTQVRFHIGSRRIRNAPCADRPGGRSLHARTVCVGNRDAICYGPSGRPVPTGAFPTWQNTYINKSNGRPRFGDGRCFFAKGLKKKRGRKEV